MIKEMSFGRLHKLNMQMKLLLQKIKLPLKEIIVICVCSDIMIEKHNKTEGSRINPFRR